MTQPDQALRDGTVTWILRGIGGATVVSTAAAFYESFDGLIGWFRLMGFRGFRAVVAPAMIDLVALTGEAIALLAIIEGWRQHRKVRGWAWAAIGYGLALSVVGNAGQSGTRPGWAGVAGMAVNAIPPVSMAILLTAVLAVVKVRLAPPAGAEVPEEVLLALRHFSWYLANPGAELPPYREAARANKWGSDKARGVLGMVRELREALAALDAPPAEPLHLAGRDVS